MAVMQDDAAAPTPPPGGTPETPDTPRSTRLRRPPRPCSGMLHSMITKHEQEVSGSASDNT